MRKRPSSEYKDEFEVIEEEFAIPNFVSVMENTKSGVDDFFTPENEPEVANEFFSTPSLFEHG